MPLLIHQNHICIFPHEFDIKMPVMDITKLVPCLDYHMQNAIQTDLIQRTKDSSVNLLSQQHEKISRCLHRGI